VRGQQAAEDANGVAAEDATRRRLGRCRPGGEQIRRRAEAGKEKGRPLSQTTALSADSNAAARPAWRVYGRRWG